MRKSVVLLLLICTSALAEPKAIPVTAGQTVPEDGIFLTVAAADLKFKQCVANELKVKELEEAIINRPPQQETTATGYLIAGGAGIAVGLVLSFFIVRELRNDS